MTPIKILNSANETVAVLQNIIDPIVSEEINRVFTLNFSTVIDNDKSSYVDYLHKAEIEDNYFNIVYTEEERTQEGCFIRAECEHVSYDLIDTLFTAGFTATGLFSAVATTVLSGTDFSIGSVTVTASETISINESTNARYIILAMAALWGAELQFSKYQISALTRRGADRGVQFRYRKNLVGVKRITDNRNQTSGSATVSYEVSAAELEFEQGYIASGASAYEHYELGDTIRVIDEGLNIDTSLRIVKESHNVAQRMQGTVQIGNFVDDLTDTLTQIQTTTVSQNVIYNGCSIGPDDGFVATRSDNLARAIMNATDGIKIQKGDGAGGWTDAIYLDTSGNGTFTGFVLAAQIIGGSIAIGTGNNIFKADGTNGISLGNATFASAPFRVTLSGGVTANNLVLTGGVFNVGTGTNTLQFNVTDGLFLGATAVATAPFSVTMSGALTATNATIIGNIEASTIVGGTFRTAASGNASIVITSASLSCQTSSALITGLYFSITDSDMSDIYFYHNGTPLAVIYDDVTGFTMKGTSSSVSFGLGGNVPICAYGDWDFSTANITSAPSDSPGLRKIYISTVDATGADGLDGDVWLKYAP